MLHSRNAEVRAALADPAFYPHAPESVIVHETHTSCVFVAGELVYKLKKPVTLGFLDYGSLEARRRYCADEVQLNERLAPGIYLGVRSVIGTEAGLALGAGDDPRALEHLVEMRRYDERLTLAGRLAEERVDPREIRRVAERIARFHASAEPIDIGGDIRVPLKSTSDETFTSLFELVPRQLERGVLAAQRFTAGFLLRRGETLAARARAGLVRDGHGDLRAEHVLLYDPIAIVDCVEFDPGLRQIDVADDLAFLSMDLERLAGPELARQLVTAYREAGGDPGDDALLAFFAAQRAWVRAKVALVRARQQREAGENQAAAITAGEELLRLGRRLAWRARQPLLLVLCGLSGSGKTHLAEALGALSGIETHGSDRVRKGLAGLEPTMKAPPERYAPDASAETYAELGRLARQELDRRGLAIVDATFRRVADRRAFAAAVGENAGAAVFAECLAPEGVRLARVEKRASACPGVSDATAQIARAQSFEELSEVPAARHLPLRTDRPVEEAVAAIEAWLDF
jgi:uncharacterized protein